MAKSTSEQLFKLRSLMVKNGIHAFIVPTQDAHQSEYIAPCDARRAFISNFTGSAGTAVITLERAALWTDGRYFLQASQQLDENWILMKHGLPETPSRGKWLSAVLKPSQIVGIDASLTTVAEKTTLEKEVAAAGIKIQPFSQNLVDLMWCGRPARPKNPLFALEERFCGVSGKEKLSALQREIKEKGCSGLILNALDDVAWLINARGSDIAFNPVFFAFAVVTLEGLQLFVDGDAQEALKQANLSACTTVHPYDSFYTFLRDFSAGNRLLIGRTSKTVAISEAAAAANAEVPLEETLHSPVFVAKAVKNDVEQAGFRSCHVRDGAALVAFFAWLEDRIGTHNDRTIDEVAAAKKLSEFRAAQPHFRGESFETISAFGAHGAIIHYDPTEAAHPATIDDSGLFLCDSGGQYLDGTTDVTRTVHFGAPTPYEKECYTAVLRGHVDLAMAKFPAGTVGSRLDTIARAPLWALGLDFCHGTGHGVGHFLNVHEGPHSISFRSSGSAADEVALKAGMTITNEPGFYQQDRFGIRIENVMLVCAAPTKYSFGEGRSLCFETITMVPYAANLIEKSLLTAAQTRWIDEYHAAVRAALLPLLPHNQLASEWLLRNTQPLAS